MSSESTTAPTPTAAFIGMILATSRDMGRHPDAMAAMRAGVSQLRPEMFPGDEARIFSAIELLLERDELPAAHPVSELASVDYERARKLMLQEIGFGTIPQTADTIRGKHRQRLVTEGLEAALAAVKKGKVDDALSISSSLDLGGASRGSYGVSSLDTFSFDLATQPHFELPYSRLNTQLGGGLGFGGKNALSLWVASSGIGKSSFWHGMIPYLLQQGLTVAYYSGEADETDVVMEIVRLMAGVARSQLPGIRAGRAPVLQDKLNIALLQLRSYPGFLRVIDDFDTSTIRITMQDYAYETEQRRKGGEPNIYAVGIVDNIDHAIQFDGSRGMREDQVYGEEGRKLLKHAQRYDYHLAMLSQTNEEGRKRNGAPEINDVARAKVLSTHVGVQISLYRPTTDDDRSKTVAGKNGELAPGPRAKHLVSVVKARGGENGVLEFDSKPATGKWFDPKEPAF